MKVETLKRLFVGVVLTSASLFGSGCLLGSGGSLTNLPQEEFALVNLHIRLGKLDATAPVDGGVLGKVGAFPEDEEIILKDMMLRFTSNLSDTVWDTVQMFNQEQLASEVGGGEQGIQSIWVNVRLAPLRWWNIEIKTHDINDSIIHYGNVGPISSKGGQTVEMVVPQLNSRFSQYEARYALPREIYAATADTASRVYQRIFFTQLVLSVDGRKVRDSTSWSPAVTAAGTRFIDSRRDTGGFYLRGDSGRFYFRPRSGPTDTLTHVQTYAYVETGTRVFDIKAFGYLEGDTLGMAPRLLFHGTRTFTLEPGAVTPPTTVKLDYTGPGSKSDTTNTTPPKPGEPNWSGVSMQVKIGKPVKVTQEIHVPSGVSIKPAVRHEIRSISE